MEKERGIVCMFCGEGFGYVGEKPDEDTMKSVIIDHEKVCPQNPYLAEIADLKEKFRIAVIHASEYKAWLEKAERENAKLRTALENLFMCGLVIGETSQYFIDAKAALERE